MYIYKLDTCILIVYIIGSSIAEVKSVGGPWSQFCMHAKYGSVVYELFKQVT